MKECRDHQKIMMLPITLKKYRCSIKLANVFSKNYLPKIWNSTNKEANLCSKIRLQPFVFE